MIKDLTTVAENNGLTIDQLKLITATIAKGATPDELQLFLYRCKSMGLDPLKPGQIHFVKYGQGPGTIVVGVDGFLARAQATKQLDGISRGIIRDAKGKCVGAWAEVRRKGWSNPVKEEVPLSEYDTGRGPWAKMPETMLKKVALVAALRMAFPDELGGVYASEEMDQANASPVVPQQPGPDDGITTQPFYTVPFGKYKQRKLDEIDTMDLANYIVWIENKAEKDGKEITGDVADFIERASDHIASLENQDVN